jgi:hypothetical protein
MKALLAFLAVALLAAGTAFADKIPNDNGTQFSSRFDCPLDGYVSCFGVGGSVPDADPVGVVFGPINCPDPGATLLDVILDAELTHTWIGDARLSLLYDDDCNGVPEVEGSVLCRHQLAGCPPDGCCGCSGDLGGLYLFSDVAPSIENSCPTFFAPDCYGPDFDSSGLDVFDGMPQPGCWWLFAADGAGGDLYTVGEWSVHTLLETGTPTESTTWGQIKARY